MKTFTFLNGLVFLLLNFILFLSSCISYPYGRIIEENDDFKNQNKTYVTFRTFAKPLKTSKGSLRKPIRAYLKFEIEETTGYEAEYTMHFTTTTQPFYDMSETLYIKTDDIIHELQFSKINNTVYIERNEECSSSSSTSTSTTTNNNGETSASSSPSAQSIGSGSTYEKRDCNKSTTTTTTTTTTDHTTKISENTLKNIRSQLIIGDGLRKSLARAKQIQIRVYIDTNAYNIDLQNNNIITVNKIMDASEKQIK